jgi:hypothetical protein
MKYAETRNNLTPEVSFLIQPEGWLVDDHADRDCLATRAAFGQG